MRLRGWGTEFFSCRWGPQARSQWHDSGKTPNGRKIAPLLTYITARSEVKYYSFSKWVNYSLISRHINGWHKIHFVKIYVKCETMVNSTPAYETVCKVCLSGFAVHALGYPGNTICILQLRLTLFPLRRSIKSSPNTDSSVYLEREYLSSWRLRGLL